MTDKENDMMTFGEHLETIRRMLFRIIAVVVALSVVIFCFKSTTFDVILAPGSNKFITYKAIERLAKYFGVDFHFEAFHIKLINTELSSQFFTHISTSLYIALLFASPYVIIELYHFIAPALYDNERKHSVAVTAAVLLLFFLGVLMSYFALFPFALRFLGTYQVAADVQNQINLSSYVSTFVTLTLLLGLVFQIPVLSFFLAKIGVLSASFMRKYRKHALIVIAVIAAVITPPDIFTCLLVMLPMCGLYELSISIVAMIGKNKPQAEAK